MEAHKIGLSNLCRTCGEKFNTRKVSKDKHRKPLPVANIKDEIFLLLGEDISQDGLYTHPDKLCRKCYLTIVNTRNIKDPMERIDKYSKEREIILSLRNEWQTHSGEKCKICEMNVRPKVPFGKSKSNMNKTVEFIPFSSELDGFVHLCKETEVESNSYVEIVLKENMWTLFNCAICQQNFKRNTVKTKCSHYFCSDCLFRFFWHGKSTQLPRPICKETISYYEIETSDWMFLKCNFSTVWRTVKTVKYMIVMQIYWITNAMVIRYVLPIRVQPANRIKPMKTLRLH